MGRFMQKWGLSDVAISFDMRTALVGGINTGAVMAPAFELPRGLSPCNEFPSVMGSDPDSGVSALDVPVYSGFDLSFDPAAFEEMLLDSGGKANFISQKWVKQHLPDVDDPHSKSYR